MGIQGAAPISTQTLNNNDWHHVVITFDGDSGLSTQYMDGVLEGATSFSETPALMNWTKVYFGQNINYHGMNSFSGELDDVGLWDRILTPCEIKQLYAAEKFTIDKHQLAPYFTCAGSTTTLVCSPSPSVIWSNGSNQNQIITTPTANTAFSATATWSVGCTTTAVYTLLVTDGPSLSILGHTNVCSGKSASIVISGATGNYTTSIGITNGTLVFAVNSATQISIKGKNLYGCMTQQTVHLIQIPSPTLTVNSGTICRGEQFTISPTGANQYSVTQQKFIIQPLFSSNYTITGISDNGCKASKVSTITVIQPPKVSIVGLATVCAQETYSLIAKNAQRYVWYGGDTSRILSFQSTPGRYFFVLTGKNEQGCMGSTSLEVVVNLCSGIAEESESKISLYPSLADYSITLKDVKVGNIYKLFDLSGQMVKHGVTHTESETLDISNLKPGIYLVTIEQQSLKFIKQ